MTTSQSFNHKDFRKYDTDEFWDNLKNEFFSTWKTDDCIIQGNGKDGLQVIFIPKNKMRTLLKIAAKTEKRGF